jgi:hypothetical protein
MKNSSYLLRRHIRYAIVSTAVFGSLAHADTFDDAKFNFAGFATFAYSKVLNEDKEGTLNDIDGDGEYRDLNKLGLRLDVDLEDKLSFATQMVVRGENDYEPDFDWIYATYQMLPNLSVSLGKTTIPLYMYSDYLDTSYAYQWIAPPDAVYSSGTVKSNEGLSLNWMADMGGAWSSDLTVWAGSTDEPLAELSGANIQVDDAIGAAWEVEREWLTLRAVYYQGKTSVDISGQAAGVVTLVNNAIGGGFNLANESSYDALVWDNDDGQFLGFGLGLDFEHVFLTGEITQVNIDNNLAASELNSWYAMFGVRLPANWTVSLTYSEDDDKVNDDIAELIVADAVAFTGAPASAFAALADGINQEITQQQQYITKNYVLGSRWDFHKSASFKMEYLVSEIESGLTPKRKPNAFRIGMDLVF